MATKTFILDTPITPEDANRWEASAETAAAAIPKANVQRAPGTGTTGGTAAALTAVVADFTLADMAGAVLKLHADIASGATLNINGSGAKPLYNAYNKPLPSGAKAGAFLAVTYNADSGRYYAGAAAGGSLANAGTTTGTAADLSVSTGTDYTLADMASVAVKLHITVAAGATLNVNGTGAKGIYTSTGRAILAGAAAAGTVINCYYSATDGRYYAIGLSEITATTIIDTNIKREQFTGDGVTRVFTLTKGSYILGGNRILTVTVGAIPQQYGDSYTETSTTSITFAVAPPSGVIIDILYIVNFYGDKVDFGTF